MALEFFLAPPQSCLIGLHFVETPADLRRFLCGHAAILVEVDWVVGHNHLAFPACAIPISRSDTTGQCRNDVSKSRHDTARIGAYTETYAARCSTQDARGLTAFGLSKTFVYIGLTSARFNSRNRQIMLF